MYITYAEYLILWFRFAVALLLITVSLSECLLLTLLVNSCRAFNKPSISFPLFHIVRCGVECKCKLYSYCFYLFSWMQGYRGNTEYHRMIPLYNFLSCSWISVPKQSKVFLVELFMIVYLRDFDMNISAPSVIISITWTNTCLLVLHICVVA